MTNALRTLCALALCVALSPLASAQGIDCNNVPVSAGAPDAAYRACAKPSEVLLPSAGPSDRSFGHDGVNTNFVTFVQNTPQVFTTVAPYTAQLFLPALDFEGNNLGTAFGLDASDQAISINTATGAVTALGTLTPNGNEQWSAITWDYVDETFYALATVCGQRTSLYEVSFSPLTRTRIGTDTSNNETCGLGLASDPVTGQLYGYGVVSEQLVTYNKANGQSMVIGPLGYSANFGQALDFDNEDGTLYVYAFNDLDFRAELRIADTTTGNTTLVGGLGTTVPGGLTQISAGASLTTGEPSLCSLALSGVDIAPSVVPQGGLLRFTGNIINAGPGAKRIALRVSYTGPAAGSFELRNINNVPPGTYPFFETRRLPAAFALGEYEGTLEAVDAATGAVCDAYTETITVTPAPRLSGTPDGTALFEAVAPDTPLFGASTTTTSSAVSPNPFAGRTQISYAVEVTSQVRLSVYDVLGREVAVLVDGAVEAGQHAATFDARGLSAGTYVYHLVVGNDVQTGRMTRTH